ncbi:MAG: hypothetical protein CBB68_07025 [Rhodospirillaceae bacterium TMED8]|nr:methyltransferase [Magnetovibrio sp.]OUT50746.1 MAG: hypothetical protein CBB68_07025 [Rhodospirillaceae bacterium TMED8]
MFRPFLNKLVNKLARAIADHLERRELHPKRLMLMDAQVETVAYIRSNMPEAMIFDRREEVLDLAIQRMPTKGSILEFGVAGGDSIRYIASKTHRTVHGFDSFRGLPEDWPGRHELRGHYSTEGHVPSVPSNVVLHEGWFEQTLPLFLEANPDPAAMIHVDCDLYSATKTLLEALSDRLTKNTIIVFDEYFNFVGWRNHEFRAFQEFITDKHLNYRYLAWSYQQVMVIIEDGAS